MRWRPGDLSACHTPRVAWLNYQLTGWPHIIVIKPDTTPSSIQHLKHHPPFSWGNIYKKISIPWEEPGAKQTIDWSEVTLVVSACPLYEIWCDIWLIIFCIVVAPPEYECIRHPQHPPHGPGCIITFTNGYFIYSFNKSSFARIQ